MTTSKRQLSEWNENSLSELLTKEDINQLDCNYEPALRYCCRDTDIGTLHRGTVVKYLLNHGAIVYEKYLNIAAYCGHIDVVEHLICRGVDINYEINGFTPIMDAIRYSDPGVAHTLVKRLIVLGADIYKYTPSEGFPIHVAIREKKHEIVKTLLEAGTPITTLMPCNFTRTSLLHTAVVCESSIEVITELINAGADVNSCDWVGRTALFYITGIEDKQHRLEVAKLLLNAGADVYRKDRYGNTALDEAIEKKDRQLLSLLQGKLKHEENVAFAVVMGQLRSLNVDEICTIANFAGFQNVSGQKSLYDMVLSVQELSGAKTENALPVS